MKLYVVVRKDLTPSQRAVQAGHALAEFLIRNPYTKWANGTLVYLQVKNKYELSELINELKNKSINFAYFREPDMKNQLTALACLQEGGELFKDLSLLR